MNDLEQGLRKYIGTLRGEVQDYKYLGFTEALDLAINPENAKSRRDIVRYHRSVAELRGVIEALEELLKDTGATEMPVDGLGQIYEFINDPEGDLAKMCEQVLSGADADKVNDAFAFLEKLLGAKEGNRFSVPDDYPAFDDE